MNAYEAAWDEYQQHCPLFGMEDEKGTFKAGWDAAMRQITEGVNVYSASDVIKMACRSGKTDMALDLAQQAMAPEITPADIYHAYPLKVGKQAALKAIKKAQKDTNIGYPKLLEATQAFATAVAQWPEAEKKYVPHPATWYNRGSYDDDPAVWQKGKPVYQSQFSTSH